MKYFCFDSLLPSKQFISHVGMGLPVVDHWVFFVSSVSHAFASVHYCLVVTHWERADLLALVGDVYCIFVTFPCGILGEVWYLIVSLPDLCRLSYFEQVLS